MKKVFGLLLMFMSILTVSKAQENDSLFQLIKIKFTLNSHVIASEEQIALITGNLNTSQYTDFRDEIDLNSVDLFQNLETGIAIAIFRSTTNFDKFYAVKGILENDNFNLHSEIMLNRNLSVPRNGMITIGNGMSEILINIEDGMVTVVGASPVGEKHGGPGFCQREKDEDFATCYKAEKDEFCTNFFSCLAVDTQTSVMIMIALACSCSVK